jgi:hypothetical protein
MAISFLGVGNQRKPLTCRKSLTNFNIDAVKVGSGHVFA